MSRAARSAAAEDGPRAERFSPAQGHTEAAAVGPDLSHASTGHAPGSGAGQYRACPDLSLGPGDDEALQRLAVAVLAHAVTELQAPPLRGKPGEHRETARQQARDWLLGGSPGLRFWSDVAGVDPDALGSRLRARLGADGDDDAE